MQFIKEKRKKKGKINPTRNQVRVLSVNLSENPQSMQSLQFIKERKERSQQESRLELLDAICQRKEINPIRNQVRVLAF
jgi:(p)ppGpp synthase/HD superfamily hydrolase